MTWSTESAPEPRHRWTRAEYDRLVALGVFEDEHVELILGDILTMSPQSALHALTIQKLQLELTLALGRSVRVRVQSPLGASDESEPEPDLAIVPLQADSEADHPRSALLVIEVAEASLRRDLGLEAALYAASDVREYWVVDLTSRALVVHRDSDGTRWTQITTLRPGATVTPVAFPDLTLPLDAFLPTA